MPAKQRGTIYSSDDGKRKGIRYFDENGKKVRSGLIFSSESKARHWLERVELPRIESAANGTEPAAPTLTLDEFVEEWLKSKAATVRPSTLETNRIRLAYAQRHYGDLELRELQHRAAELAQWAPTLGGMRYPVMNSLRSALDAAVRWRYMDTNPAKDAGPNPQPRSKTVETFTLAEIDAVALELGEPWGGGIVFALEAMLRPSEFLALERRDVQHGALVIQRSLTGGLKTTRSLRRVPLTARAEAALATVPPRIDTRLLFANEAGGYYNLHNWRNRIWYPALEAAGLKKRGPNALRHTGITNMLAAGVSSFDVARYAGTSLEMIERTYGHLVTNAGDHARRLMAGFVERQSEEIEGGAVNS